GGLFGASTAAPLQPAQSGGLFGGALNAQPQQQSGGLFGSTAAASQPQQSGGLFGLTMVSSQPQQTGGLFGNTAPSQSQQTGGLFGNTAASQPQQNGGLFGQSAAASQPQQSGGLFGNSTAAAQPQTGGLFGQTQSSQPQQSNSGGLFSFNQSSQPGAALGGAPKVNLFGSTAATTSQPQSNSLFSGIAAPASQPQQQPATLGAPQANAQSQQTVPGVKIDASNIKPTTRMFELHEDIQNMIIQIDDMISGGIRTSMSCSGVLPQLGAKIDQLPTDVAYLESKLETVEGALVRDALDVGDVKDVVRSDATSAMTLFGAIENLKLPNQFHYSGMGNSSMNANLQTSANAATSAASSSDLLSYFNTQAEELAKRTESYEQQLKEVEMHLRTVEGSAVEGIERLIRQRSGEGGISGEGIRELVGAMRGFEEAVLRVAGRMGEVREKVVDVSLGQGGVRL
ncbi:hypothetical protein EJ08DRAFT_594390, partial [Tothia fuscella]